MKTFDEIYEELQNRDKSELNIVWKEAEKANKEAKKISGIICLIVDVFVIMFSLKDIISSGSLDLLVAIVMKVVFINLGILLLVSMKKETERKYNVFNDKYKKILINKLMGNFYNNLEYFPNKEMPEYIYEKLQYEHYDRYSSEDYFEALINKKNSIQMAEILTQKEKKHTNSETILITKFHGLFAKIELDKSINEELRIMQNGDAFLRGNKLKMDSSEFEKYFDVQTSNKIVGMQLLTADVMEELIDFENKTKMKYDIFIKGNELYLRFHSGAMFETTTLKNGPVDKKTMEQYFYMLNFTYNLSNMLINLINDVEI